MTITDEEGATVTSDRSVTVSQTFTSSRVDPPTASVTTGTTRSFTAFRCNPFGADMATSTLVWTVTAGSGSITAGVFTALATPDSTTVTANDGGKTATATITIVVASGGGAGGGGGGGLGAGIASLILGVLLLLRATYAIAW